LYRNGKFRKIPKIWKNTEQFSTKHFVHYELEKVNYLTYNDNNHNNNSMVNNSCESRTFLKLILYIILPSNFILLLIIGNRKLVIYHLPITNFWFLPKILESYRLHFVYRYLCMYVSLLLLLNLIYSNCTKWTLYILWLNDTAVLVTKQADQNSLLFLKQNYLGFVTYTVLFGFVT